MGSESSHYCNSAADCERYIKVNIYKPINTIGIYSSSCDVAISKLSLISTTELCPYGYIDLKYFDAQVFAIVLGGSNMTGTDLCVNKPHCAADVRP